MINIDEKHANTFHSINHAFYMFNYFCISCVQIVIITMKIVDKNGLEILSTPRSELKKTFRHLPINGH